MRHYLYKITNHATSKVYIGQTVNRHNRWSRHKSDAKRQPKYPIHLSMAKHGIDKFTFEVIAETMRQDWANELEIILIAQYRSKEREFGYNLTVGGKSSSGPDHPAYGKKHSPEWIAACSKPRSEQAKLNMSRAQKAKPNRAMLGKTHSEATRQRMSETAKGRTFSAEAKTKMSLAKRAFTEAQEAEVIELYLSGLSMKEIGKKFGVTKKPVSNALKRHGIT